MCDECYLFKNHFYFVKSVRNSLPNFNFFIKDYIARYSVKNSFHLPPAPSESVKNALDITFSLVLKVVVNETNRRDELRRLGFIETLLLVFRTGVNFDLLHMFIALHVLSVFAMEAFSSRNNLDKYRPLFSGETANIMGLLKCLDAMVREHSSSRLTHAPRLLTERGSENKEFFRVFEEAVRAHPIKRGGDPSETETGHLHLLFNQTDIRGAFSSSSSPPSRFLSLLRSAVSCWSRTPSPSLLREVQEDCVLIVAVCTPVPVQWASDSRCFFLLATAASQFVEHEAYFGKERLLSLRE